MTSNNSNGRHRRSEPRKTTGKHSDKMSNDLRVILVIAGAALMVVAVAIVYLIVVK